MEFPQEQSHYININGFNLHYIQYPGKGPTIILMHGLTANAHAFDGLVARGLADHFNVISVDLRGRGLSDYPAFAYSIEEHADDILGLLDHLGIPQATLIGHSFGGLLSMYLAAKYPKRVERLVILDAAAEMNRNAGEMLQPTLSRLDKIYASWDSYINEMRSAPYTAFWEEAMDRYYRADVKETIHGSVTPRPVLANILQVAYHVGNTPWKEYVEQIAQPAILINALDAYTMDEPLLPDEKAKETVELMQNCTYKPVDGNHHTMLYGIGAGQIIGYLLEFLRPAAIPL